MFEQSVLTHERRPWTMAASLTIQSAIAGTIVLLSVITVQQLPVVSVPMPLPPVRRISEPAVELVATGVANTTSMLQTAITPKKVFHIPTSIPSQIAMINEDLSGLVNASPGMPATTGSVDGVANGILFTGTRQEAVPAPPPVIRNQAEPVDQPVRRIRVGGNVQEAKLLNRVIPAYPPLARAARISGKVQLVALIGRDGKIAELQVISGHPLLVQSAVNAVRQWVYSPTLLNGEPVEVIAPIDVNFTMSF